MTALRTIVDQLDRQQRWRDMKSHALALLERKVPWDESKHPRNPPGSPGGTGGEFQHSGGGDDDRHPGEDYSAQAYIKDGVIHTNDVEDAAIALYEGRKVHLDQPRQVSLLLDRLGEITKLMIEKGQKAPLFDLCNVTVKGTNLFCVESHGIPRAEMPQLPTGKEGEFKQWLIDKGYEVKTETIQAKYLRATQSQLNGAKVAGIAGAMRKNPDLLDNPIFVSQDDYILDGHHRWGAKIGVDADDGVLGNGTVLKTERVMIPITTLLEEADEFTGGKGKVAVGDSSEDAKAPGARLTSKMILREAGKVKPNSVRVTTLASNLNERASAIIKEELGIDYIDMKQRTAATDEYVASVIARELHDALKSGKSAADWYNKTQKEAMVIAEKMYPEIATDPNARFMYTAALSITSQGEVVDQSARLADTAYTHFRKTGKFPTDMPAADPNIKINLIKVNRLVKELGLDGAREFFDKQMTKAELSEATGVDVSLYGVDEMVYGSAMLGPKIGQGFYQNLNGNFKPITVDMWFMRAWGRVTNTGIMQSDMTKQFNRFTNALKSEGKRVPRDTGKQVELARKIYDKHEKDYAKHKSEYKSGERKKSELVLSSERLLYHHDGAMVEMPRSIAHRQYIDEVFRKAVGKLKSDYDIDIEPAAAQATWWTPEQNLYDALGARVRDNDTNYAKSLAKVARSKGIVL